MTVSTPPDAPVDDYGSGSSPLMTLWIVAIGLRTHRRTAAEISRL